MSDDAHEVQKILREALEAMPVTIESGLLNPNTSATGRLNWVKLATRLLQDPIGRPVTEIDIENKRKAAQILKAAVPALEKIRDEHRSERLRNTAARYLRFIATEVGNSH
jgi:hypothetical protein